MALESVARGERPLFVFDSYSTLVANFNEKQGEIDSQFAQPLQNLQKAMSGTGATTVVLHHTPKSGVGSIASSGSGAGRLGRIPDVVIAMESVGRYSNRLFITSSKRVVHTSLIIEQDFDAGQWVCHGDAVQARELKELISKVAALKGPAHKIYHWAMPRWENAGLPFSSEDVKHVIETSVQTARSWIRKLDADGLIFQCDVQRTAGKDLPLYLPSEYREEWGQRKAREGRERYEKLAKSTAPQAYEKKEEQERDEARVWPEPEPPQPIKKWTTPAYGERWMPCHPVDSQVTYEGKVWTVTRSTWPR